MIAMHQALALSGRLLISLVLVYLYYQPGKKALFGLAMPLARYAGLTRRHSASEATAVMELFLAGLSHVTFCGALMLILGIRWSQLGIASLDPILALYGALIGLGSMATSSLLCRISIAVLQRLVPGRVPGDLRNWLGIARAGWLRHHFRTVEIVPLPLAILLIVVQVTSEEVVFRGIFINYFIDFGAFASLTASVTLFTLMQGFHMPSAQSALFPVVGAFVMGIVHGILYLNVPCLIPLVIAHITFFAVSVL